MTMTLEEMKKKWPDNPHLEEKPELIEDRIDRLVKGYEHGMAQNGPRTTAELVELKAILAELAPTKKS